MAKDTQVRTMLSIQATPDLSGIRTGEMKGAEYTIIPCIALCEGVLWPANAPHPELALAEEFGRFPDGWNGRPIMMGHPKANGMAVSASNPAILDNASFGQMFNTEVTNDGKLKTEIWIDNARVVELGGEIESTVARLLEADNTVEVSTGLFTMNEMVAGEYNGEHFEAIWRNIVPDHLAILPEGIVGACSVADGCGAPRANEGGARMQPVMRAAQLATSADPACSCKSSDDDEPKGLMQRLLEKFGTVLNIKDNSDGLSDRDLRTALSSALSAEFPDEYHWVMAVFESSFVYETGFSDELFERSFSVDEGGVVHLASDSQAVRPETKFVPLVVTTNASDDDTPTEETQENDMSIKTLVASLIANEATQYTKDDNDWLLSLNEEQLTKMSPPEPAVDEEVDPSIAIAAAAEQEVLDAAAAAAAKPVTAEDFIANAPPEIAEVLKNGLAIQAGRKSGYVKALLANGRNRFSEPELTLKSLEELENLAALANVVTFEGAGTVLTEGLRYNADPGFTPAPDIFAVPAA